MAIFIVFVLRDRAVGGPSSEAFALHRHVLTRVPVALSDRSEAETVRARVAELSHGGLPSLLSAILATASSMTCGPARGGACQVLPARATPGEPTAPEPGVLTYA